MMYVLSDEKSLQTTHTHTHKHTHLPSDEFYVVIKRNYGEKMEYLKRRTKELIPTGKLRVHDFCTKHKGYNSEYIHSCNKMRQKIMHARWTVNLKLKQSFICVAMPRPWITLTSSCNRLWKEFLHKRWQRLRVTRSDWWNI